MWRGVIPLLLAIAGGYLLLVVAVYFYQPHLLFLPGLPSRQLASTPADIDLAYEDIDLQTRDGVQLHGWWVNHPQPRATILFFHGNAGNISHRLQTLRLFHQLGYQSLIIDYRGYGQSGGRPSEQGLYADAEAAWRYLRDVRQLPPGEIILSGRSLGAAVALYLAEQHTPRALIIESAFTSIPDMAAVHYGWLPVRWLSRYQFDNRRRIANLDCPVLIVHAREDEIAPYEQGRELYRLAPSPRQWLALNGGHNDAQLNDYLTYTRGLQEFLARH